MNSDTQLDLYFRTNESKRKKTRNPASTITEMLIFPKAETPYPHTQVGMHLGRLI